MKLKPIKNHIIFKFKEDVDNQGYFKKTTDWGFEIRGHADDSAKSPRWVTVVEVGPECKDVKIGDDILVKPLKWSMRFKVDGEQFWRTDEDQVIAADTVSGELGKPEHTFRAFGESIIFRRTDVPTTKTASGIEVQGKLDDDTAHGKVVEIGPKVSEDLKGATVYFLDQNFFGYFEYRTIKFCYLEDKEILAYIPKE